MADEIRCACGAVRLLGIGCEVQKEPGGIWHSHPNCHDKTCSVVALRSRAELAEARLADAAKVSPMCADNLRLRERAEKAEAQVADCLGYIDAVIEDRDQYENECYVAEAQAERLAGALRDLLEEVDYQRSIGNFSAALMKRARALRVLSEYQGRQAPEGERHG